MALAAVNKDVLMEILSHLSSSDLSTLSRTNRALYAPSTQQLLTDVLVHPGHQLTTFASYMLADPSARLRHVRTLRVSPGELGSRIRISALKESLRALVEVLRALRDYHLSSFVFKLPRKWSGIEAWMGDFNDSVAALPHLESLRLDVGIWDQKGLVQWVSVFQGMCSNLRSLSLSPIIWKSTEPHRIRELFPCLHAQQSLQTLSLTDVLILKDSPRLQGLRWDSLHTLKLDETFIPLAILSRMFPHVRVFEANHYDPPAHLPDDRAIWRHLDRLVVAGKWVGDMLGRIHCPVRELEVRCVDLFKFFEGSDLKLLDLRLLHLSVLRPFILRLELFSTKELKHWQENLAEQLISVGTLYLEITVYMAEAEDDLDDIDGALDWARNISHYLSRAPLLCMRILNELSPLLLPEDVHAVAQVLAEGIPALQYCIMQCGCTERGARSMESWMAVKRDNGAAVLVEIGAEEGKTAVNEILKCSTSSKS